MSFKNKLSFNKSICGKARASFIIQMKNPFYATQKEPNGYFTSVWKILNKLNINLPQTLVHLEAADEIYCASFHLLCHHVNKSFHTQNKALIQSISDQSPKAGNFTIHIWIVDILMSTENKGLKHKIYTWCTMPTKSNNESIGKRIAIFN